LNEAPLPFSQMGEGRATTASSAGGGSAWPAAALHAAWDGTQLRGADSHHFMSSIHIILCHLYQPLSSFSSYARQSLSGSP